MHVLVVNSYNRINERLKNEIWALTESGHDVDVLLWDRGAVGHTQRTAEERERLNIDRLEFEAPAGSWTFLLYLPVFYLYFLRSLFTRDYETVHCAHPGLLPVCVVAAKLRGKSVVYDVFELHIDGFYGDLPTRLKYTAVKRLFENIENLFVKLADGVVTIDTVDDYLIERYSRYNENAAALYNVPRRVTSPDPDIVEYLEDEYGDSPLVVHVGGLSRDKGVVKMIKSMYSLQQRVPDVQFLCIGSFRDDSRVDIEDFVERHDLENTVEFRPWMEFEKMLGYLAVADVGLALYQPRFRYRVSRGNSRKVFTYMSVKLPVVASQSSGISDIVESVGCGVSVEETDPFAIADGIEGLLSNSTRRTVLGSTGQTAVEETYNWEQESEKLLTVYDRLTT